MALAYLLQFRAFGGSSPEFPRLVSALAGHIHHVQLHGFLYRRARHAAHARQWQRLQYTVILTSVPIALYGILQHFALDSLPWGGDTTLRVAGNMGNAIFLAAYLIMAVPLTVERLITAGKRMLLDEAGNATDALMAGGCCSF